MNMFQKQEDLHGKTYANNNPCMQFTCASININISYDSIYVRSSTIQPLMNEMSADVSCFMAPFSQCSLLYARC